MLPSELPDVQTAVVWDTETSGLFPDAGARVSTAIVAFAWEGQDHAYAWPFAQDMHGKPEADRVFRRKRLGDQLGPDQNLPIHEWAALVSWLAGRRAGLIAHNALFDLILTEAGTCPRYDDPGVPGVDLSPLLVWDTMLGQRVLDPEHPLGLKDVALRVFGVQDPAKDELVKHLKARGYGSQTNPRYDLADWEVMRPYAVWDGVQTLRLARHQWHRFHDGEQPFNRMRHEVEVCKTLCRMERRGVPYNTNESLRWADKIQTEVDRIAADLPFEDKPAQVRHYFFGAGQTERGKPCLELDPVKMTAGSKPGAKVKKAPEPSVDAEVIRTLVEKGVPSAHEYQQLALLSDANSRYYRGYALAVGPDGRLRTRFRQTGTRTGRLSCERVNLQAIPHDHRMLASGSEVLQQAPSPRALIHAIPGYKLWHMDLAQAELRVASLFAGCERMLQIVREGRDPHGETAIELGLATGSDDPRWKAMRGVGKRGNFSLIFGIGPAKFKADLRLQVGIDLPLPQVQKIVRDWNALYPEFGEAINNHMKHARRAGWTPIRDGIRRYYTEYERQIHDEHKAFNSKVQGNLGYFGREWMVAVDELLMVAGVDTDRAGLLLNIHDALLLMVPDTDDGQRLAYASAQIARDLWAQWFPGVPGDVDVTEWQTA